MTQLPNPPADGQVPNPQFALVTCVRERRYLRLACLPKALCGGQALALKMGYWIIYYWGIEK